MAATPTLLERPRRRSDARLVRRVSGGDREALGTIFERYQQELYRFCLGLLGEPQDAQDALQNTMVKALRALPGEQREIALRPWLYRIAHNEAIELRRGRRETQALDGHLPDAQSSVVEKAEQRERLEWVLKDLGDLPERQRSVLVMRELSGLDFAEIGAALGTSGGVVRQTLYEARRNLEQMDRGRSLRCEAVARVLSDGDGRVTGRREIRAHLRRCPDCRKFGDGIQTRKQALAGIAPLPPAAAMGILQSALGGGAGGSSAAGLVAAAGGGAAKTIGVPGLLKAVAAVAVVAVVGTAEVERAPRGHSGAGSASVSRSPGPGRAVRDSGPVEKAGAAPRLRAPTNSAARPSVPASAVARGEAGASPRTLAARRSIARSAKGPAASVGSPTADTAAPVASGPAAAAASTAPVGAQGADAAGSPNSEEQAKSLAKAQKQEGSAAAGAAAPAGAAAHPEHPVHPEHPAHPTQSQKPAEEEASVEGEAAPEEAAPILAPETEEPTTESDSTGSNGKAKGKEKKTQG